MSGWASEEGTPLPLGVTRIEAERAYNFALYSKHAERVTLLLYTENDLSNPCFRYQFDHLKNKSGGIWHCRISEAEVGRARYYAYSIAGPGSDEKAAWHRFDPEKILLDPYARSVFFPAAFERVAACRPGSDAGKAPVGLIRPDSSACGWGRDPRPHHESDSIIYELHVRGFTNHASSGIDPAKRGTYAGLIEKVPYLKELGITVVELMPVFQFDPGEGDYWGYSPLNVFSPHQAYASNESGKTPREEFCALVKALHEAGIEVVLDVVYNHTCEGNHEGPVYSYKGIDNSIYYLMTDGPEGPHYANASGTGNTLNCAEPNVRKLVLDSLRYWVNAMHVDGFRFDLASIFTRQEDGTINLDDPPIIADIAADPDLAGVRLIAEPWDAGGAYQLGRRFPGVRWSQWNAQFRDDLRRFVRGDAGMVPALMTRLYGSDDIFPDDREHAYHAYQSINFITAHDGFTLYDLLSFDHKRNDANGENNADGVNENFSWNCGHEGDEAVPPDVMALRKQQAKNLCCLLLLANGTPMLLAGDEFLHTQRGNNNAHAQDNEISWLDWSRRDAHADVFRFIKRMIAFRKAHPSLGRSRFWRGDVHWHGVGPDPDTSPESRSLAFCVLGASHGDVDVYAMINAFWEDLTFTLQEGDWQQWKRVIDTAEPSPEDICDAGREKPLSSQEYKVRARSVVVLVRGSSA